MKEFNSKNYAEDMKKKIPAYELMFELIFQAILPLTDKEKVKNVLLIGGQANEINGISEVFPDASMTVIEPNEKMLTEAKRQTLSHEKVEFIGSKFEDYVTDKKYDICICLLVLQFVEDDEFFLSKIYGCLEQAGVLFLSIFSSEMLEYWKNFAIARGADKGQVSKTCSQQAQVMKVLSLSTVEKQLLDLDFIEMEKILQVLSVALWRCKK